MKLISQRTVQVVQERSRKTRSERGARKSVALGALEVINVMRSINLRFTYLLTYLLTRHSLLLEFVHVLHFVSKPQNMH